MIYELRLPAIMAEGTPARIEQTYVVAGDVLAPGRKLFDLSIDLSARYGQNCPPISYYRVVSRERGVLRTFSAAPGAVFEPHAALGLVAADPAEPIGAGPARALRITTAGIMEHERMWSAMVHT
jgi:hypothetical protein